MGNLADIFNTFSWSISRDREFGECRRKYYYAYYGSWNGWDPKKGGDRAQELYMLKKLVRKEIWIGSVVHDVIKYLLRHYKAGYPADYRSAESFLVERMAEDVKSSRQKLYLKDPAHRTGFFEDEYGKNISDEEVEQAIAYAKKCLQNFFNSREFATLIKADKGDWLSIDEEKFDSFSIDGIEIRLKVDAALRRGERIAIFDWKTGKDEEIDYSKQLTCYALFATKKWGCAPSQVDAFEVNLATPKTIPHHGLTARIEWFEDHVRKRVSEMKRLLKNPEKNEADEKDFPQVNELRKCSRCNYLRVCKPAVLPNGELP